MSDSLQRGRRGVCLSGGGGGKTLVFHTCGDKCWDHLHLGCRERYSQAPCCHTVLAFLISLCLSVRFTGPLFFCGLRLHIVSVSSTSYFSAHSFTTNKKPSFHILPTHSHLLLSC